MAKQFKIALVETKEGEIKVFYTHDYGDRITAKSRLIAYLKENNIPYKKLHMQILHPSHTKFLWNVNARGKKVKATVL